MMLKRSLAAAALFVLALPVTLSAAETKTREGQWETTMTMDIPGMGPHSFTTTHCITKEEAANPETSLPQPTKDGKCAVSDYRVDGSKVTWSIKCDEQKITGSGEMSFTADAYSGAMKMNMQGRDMQMKFAGKRLGDCK